MLGQSTAALEVGFRRGIQSVIGTPSIHERQKWMAAWPHLTRLPVCGVRVLDAGCGTGAWALELARLRPGWEIVGIDRDEVAVRAAEHARQRLRCSNVVFASADFLQYRPLALFDVVLSVHSAHYLAASGKGDAFFAAVRSWLNPGGRLMLLGPRRFDRAPFLSQLPGPKQPWNVFSGDDLRRLCEQENLAVEVLQPTTSRLGAAAKQLAWATESRGRLLSLVLWPIEWCLTAIDSRRRIQPADPSVGWLLIASAASDSGCQPARS
ncbi:MAG TPA: methyltransferase domain-containing protein [Bryobacteraceae bacterium]|nr:methyltransferase domain-containing protein [Bryobacteraceae bacterium]